MKLEQQLASLDLCKRLRELGVKQESIFWFKPTGTYPTLMIVGEEKTEGYYSALTVAELGEMLKHESAGFFRTTFWVGGTEQKWFVSYGTNNDEPAICADTEADARAKMLIYLLENKLITV